MKLLLLIPLTGFVLLAGCAAPVLREMPDDPNYPPFAAHSALPEFQSKGSIQYARFGTSLFSDRRAAQIGDIITVRLQEKTQASKDADTQINKDSGVQFNEGLLLGDSVNVGDHSLETNLEQKRDFKGEAASSQSNSLTGSIAVSVIDVLPNGLLRVRGEKWLQLNRGNEYIRLTGLLRQEDIGPDNSVASTQLADARIGYSGTGELAQSNNMGWLGKFFNGGWWPL
ncbi:MAG: flagellar basal body L-ring protein FlgH [Gammaproteobacteria bacterium]|nr:flagellar basal body L-ring protein FlgH [Gammaproteobacteria bacterium]